MMTFRRVGEGVGRGRPAAGGGRGRLAAALAAALAAGAAGCSLLLSEDKAQCSTTDECRGLGASFADSVCDAGRCTLPAAGAGSAGSPGGAGGGAGGAGGGAGGDSCAKNSDCLGSTGPSLCREQRCVALASEDCTKSYGVPSDDDSQNTVIGFMTALNPTSTQSFLGRSLERTFAVARSEYEEAVATLSAAPRAPVVVVCDEVTNPVRAAQHLVGELGVRLIVGPTFDRNLTAVSDVTRPAGALLISPTADDLALTQPPLNQGDDAVWSCRPNRSRVAAYYQSAVDEALKVFEAARPAVYGTVRAVMIAPDDPSTVGFVERVEGSLRLNGQLAKGSANYKRINHPWSLTQRVDADALSNQVRDAAQEATPPNLILFPSSIDRVELVIEAIEAKWPAGVERPAYLLDEPIEDVAGLVTRNQSLRPRILGVRPHRDARSRAAEKAYLDAYEAEFGANSRPLFKSEYAFDCFYTAVFALSAGRSGGPIRIEPTGAAMRRGVGLLAGPGNEVAVGKTGAAVFFPVLVSTGGPVELAGASGPLTYEPGRVDPDASGELYCVNDVNGFCGTGVIFSSVNGAVTTEDSSCVCGGAIARRPGEEE